MGDNVIDPMVNRKHKIRIVQISPKSSIVLKHTQAHIPHTHRKQAKLICLNTDKLVGFLKIQLYVTYKNKSKEKYTEILKIHRTGTTLKEQILIHKNLKSWRDNKPNQKITVANLLQKSLQTIKHQKLIKRNSVVMRSRKTLCEVSEVIRFKEKRTKQVLWVLQKSHSSLDNAGKRKKEQAEV